MIFLLQLKDWKTSSGKDYIEMLQEFIDYQSNLTPDILELPCRNEEEYQNIQEEVQKRKEGNHIDRDWYQDAYYYLAYDKNRLVGVGCIRNHLTELGYEIWGNIAYGIRPTERKKGYGTSLAKVLIEETKKLGISEVILCHYEDNKISPKIFQKLGATYTNSVLSTETNKQIKRYRLLNKEVVLKNVKNLYRMWKEKELGGEVMPEDENPHLPKDSLENYLYFTLPMALNYQRNSYTLWEAANKTYQDEETRFVFSPKECLKRSFEEVQQALTKYKVALQKQKQTEIWLTLCKTIEDLYEGDIRKLFLEKEENVDTIRDFIQIEEKKRFPYLSGTKICNYWLYVIMQYTNQKYKNPENLTVAPDTHVIKSTYRLGLITKQELERSDVQKIVIERWNELLKEEEIKPIDIHTALWLWSRNGFQEIKEK